MRPILRFLLLLSALLSCGGDCDDDGMRDEICVPGTCADPAPAEVYGPCDAGACEDMCLPAGDGTADVCAAPCGSAADCDPCAPEGGLVACVQGQCVVRCRLTSAPECPEGMVCDWPSALCMWPMGGLL